MMKLVTAEWMRQIDRKAIDGHKIPGLRLMENAGQGIAERILNNLIESPADTAVAVFCGKGNNGGDGFVIARLLHEAECNVTVYFAASPDEFSKDARSNYDRALALEIDMTQVTERDDLPESLECDFVVDALFGTGFSGSPSGITGEIINYINAQEGEVISIDIPSGLNGDDGSHQGSVVRADFTYALALPKYGLFVTPGRELSGQVEVVPIGIPKEVEDEFDLNDNLLSDAQVTSMLPTRSPEGHKGTFGKLYLLAGSNGMTGAAALASLSALRSGCGIATIGCPASVQQLLAAKSNEVMTQPLPDVGKKGKLALRGLGEIKKSLSNYDAVVIGPGLGQHHETFELVRRLVASLCIPAIIDADGLNALSTDIDILSNSTAPLVITPHPREFERLSGMTPPNEIQARMKMAAEFAKKHSIVLVLKGSPTVVASYDGACYLSPNGNHGMATAGSGDVLSGMIGSFLAQKLAPLEAALCGVYAHGLAGDLAADELTARAMIAGDIIDYLPNAFDWLE